MSRGFTLVEVVMALALFGVVSLAGGALLEAAARSAREAESRERLLWVAGSILDSLRSREAWSSGESDVPGGARVRWRMESDGGILEAWPRGGEEPWFVVPIGSPVSPSEELGTTDG